MQYRSRAQAGPRVSALPVILMALAALLVLGVLFVGYRMVSAGKPTVALGAPFAVVGRNAPLVIDVKDARHGVTALKVTVTQEGAEQVILDESVGSPGTELEFAL